MTMRIYEVQNTIKPTKYNTYMQSKIYQELMDLHLGGMAEQWEAIEMLRKKQDVSLNDGIQMLIQAEKERRSVSKTARLIKHAKFRYNATIEEVVFDSARGKDKDRILHLASCEYIRQGAAVLITGPSGVGKSFLATALGYQACLAGYKVVYINMHKLLEKIQLARVEGTIAKFFEKMADLDLLIIDDYGMKILDGQQLLDFMELIEDRHGRKSTIISSQLPVGSWYEVLAKNATIADAILDRMVNTSHIFELKGESMRK